MQKTKSHSHSKKRHGLHHGRGKRYRDVYFPYLPAVAFIVLSILINGFQFTLSQNGVLAYATEMNASGLLSSTNQKRADNETPSLKLNRKLSSAAQAKAKDMVERDYWSHNTPDGAEPWVFYEEAGYKYLKAGENLAYGFATSAETVTGWMNSPGHKANMLDSAFTEVGFGFANSSDFQDNGEQTIVVAMYAKPQTLAATSNSESPAAAQPAQEPAGTGQATPSQVAEPPEPTQEQSAITSALEQPSTSNPSLASIPQRQISQAQSFTGGYAPWITFTIGLLSGAAVVALLLNHSWRLSKFFATGGKLLRSGENFIMHHPVLDITLVSFLALMTTLSQSVGIIL